MPIAFRAFITYNTTPLYKVLILRPKLIAGIGRIIGLYITIRLVDLSPNSILYKAFPNYA